MNKPITYIVVGMNRGGTSAVAATLNAIDIPLGDSFYSPIFEDIELGEAFRCRDWRKVKSLAHRYSEKLGTFAWKLPDSIWHLERIHKLFVNPRYIFVYRDAYAIASRVQQIHGRKLAEALNNVNRGYSQVAKFVKKKQPVALHVSYEKLLLKPEEFANTLLDFIDAEQSETKQQTIVSAIDPSPAEYNAWVNKTLQDKVLKEAGLRGHLDRVTGEQADGWLICTAKVVQEEPLHVDVKVNGKAVGSAVVKDSRKDLVNKKIVRSDKQMAGFSFKFQKRLPSGSQVSVVESKTGIELIGSPRLIE